ncbi:hypothetical protein, partial [Listeria monocytogenes]|uniref:hypothetical protein n=1 Tax=Listeria monocytogenes TaxID=1639 RepID=UPI003F66756F
ASGTGRGRKVRQRRRAAARGHVTGGAFGVQRMNMAGIVTDFAGRRDVRQEIDMKLPCLDVPLPGASPDAA